MGAGKGGKGRGQHTLFDGMTGHGCIFGIPAITTMHDHSAVRHGDADTWPISADIKVMQWPSWIF